MNEIEQIKQQQKAWGSNNGVDLDQDNYVKEIAENFFIPLSDETVRDLKGGDGSEIKDDNTRTKVYATHSSSALACNVFEYWRYHDKSILGKSMQLGKSIKTMCFEQKLSMGMKGRMPNLDVFMILEDGQSVAIESKFTEWMSRKSKKDLFTKSYFENGIKRWSDVGLPNCQKVAEKLNKKPDTYKYLNATQLLKHALGLAKMHSNSSILLYLYYDFKDSEISKTHTAEIDKFREDIQEELSFRGLTYQDLFKSMTKHESKIGQEYLDYLKERYFAT